MISTKKHRHLNVFGIQVGTTSFDESPRLISELVEKKAASYVCIINVHVLVTGVRDHHFRRILNAADWTFPDGVPLVWYARHHLGLTHVERVAGPSLMTRCFHALQDVKHFFYGTTDHTLSKLTGIAKQRYPNINISGCISPPFRPLRDSERKEIIACINDVSPDIIWVSLGAPKQETWMWEMRKEINRGVMIGVGAAFDYFVGNIKRPPVWIQRFGLEWLCRLYQDPVRLSKRYLITNSLFLFYLAKDLIFNRANQTKGK